jgi:saccharopine dehydrogenase-like NADP-dependent oxidoreductase
MKIGILGAGKIGRTLGHMLRTTVRVTSVTLSDTIAAPDVIALDAGKEEALIPFVRAHDAVVSALPFHLNKAVAAICAREGRSYFDFTEDTETTAFIQSIATPDLGASFAPQCGLAPGAINIFGADLVDRFESARTLEMRVGALPASTTNQMAYYLSWSSAGLINEYLQPCDALHRGQPIKTLPLDGVEQIVLDGVTYEAFNTSGGVATMCETYAGKVQDLTYKTMRYPGHRDHMRFVIEDLGLGERPDLLTEIFDRAVPLTTQDVVLLYANATGSIDGKLHQRSVFKKVRGGEVGGFTAIQATTAAGMAAVIELWAAGKLKPGFVRQEQIRLQDFLETQWGQAAYG